MFEYVEVASTSVDAVGYDRVARTLAVRFCDGSEYHYSDVPEDVYRGILTADSAGGYFNRHVKEAGFPYVRVE